MKPGCDTTSRPRAIYCSCSQTRRTVNYSTCGIGKKISISRARTRTRVIEY